MKWFYFYRVNLMVVQQQQQHPNNTIFFYFRYTLHVNKFPGILFEIYMRLETMCSKFTQIHTHRTSATLATHCIQLKNIITLYINKLNCAIMS